MSELLGVKLSQGVCRSVWESRILGFYLGVGAIWKQPMPLSGQWFVFSLSPVRVPITLSVGENVSSTVMVSVSEL